MMNTKVTGGKKEGDLIKINVENAKGGNPKTVRISPHLIFIFMKNFRLVHQWLELIYSS